MLKLATFDFPVFGCTVPCSYTFFVRDVISYCSSNSLGIFIAYHSLNPMHESYPIHEKSPGYNTILVIHLVDVKFGDGEHTRDWWIFSLESQLNM